jgi:hypothetical protein
MTEIQAQLIGLVVVVGMMFIIGLSGIRPFVLKHKNIK